MGKLPGRLKTWQPFLEWWARDDVYWYFPKGRAVQSGNVIEAFRIFKQFEGSTWNDAQAEFLDALEDADLFSRRGDSQTEQDATAMARMYRIVFQFLGLAWIEDKEKIVVTPAGNAYLSANDPSSITARQVQRYQVYNPTQGRNVLTLRIRPHIFLLDVLLHCSFYITHMEYVLFVSRAKTHEELDLIVAWINDFRKLSFSDQNLVEQLASELHDFGGRRTNLVNTISLNRSYAMQFLTYCDYLDRPGGGLAVKLKLSAKYEAEDIVRKYRTEAVFIHFDDEKDWFSYYGDHERFPTREEATDFYIDSGQPERMADVAASRDIIDAQISERILEDYLEKNIHLLEDGLELIGRQYRTITGPIDLLCRDKAGAIVVVELKKGRASDRVIGQLLRYIGHVRTNEVDYEGQEVRGIIVSKTVDKNLEMAIAGMGANNITTRTFNATIAIN